MVVGPIVAVALDSVSEKMVLCVLVAVANLSFVTFAATVDTATLSAEPIV